MTDRSLGSSRSAARHLGALARGPCEGARLLRIPRGPAVTYISPADEFRDAERRLKDVLLGDGMYVPGKLKGEDVRAQVRRDLRRMRDAFDAARATIREGQSEAEARVVDLEGELKRIAASKARRASDVIGPPPEPEAGGGRDASTAKTGSRTSKAKTGSRAPKARARAKTRRRGRKGRPH
jgi:hypothetical protein